MTVYTLLPSKFLLEQLSDLSSDGKRVLNKRLLLVKENPFRNPGIPSVYLTDSSNMDSRNAGGAQKTAGGERIEHAISLLTDISPCCF
jgi:hypothetical protein